MVLWRERHPDYGRDAAPVSMLDYLALRLVLERIYAQRLCRDHWQIEASLDMLRWYFRRNPEELLVRQALFGGPLPEYLAARAARRRRPLGPGPRASGTGRAWPPCIWTWRAQALRPRRDHGSAEPPCPAWPLFRLAQHLGLAGADLRGWGPRGRRGHLACLDALDEDRAGYLWLRAFERHYREQILDRPGPQPRPRTLVRAGGADTPRGPAQVMFCMDDREEGIRRHLEELAPEIETLGAAAHFSVPHNWRGLDDTGGHRPGPGDPGPGDPHPRGARGPAPECEACWRGPLAAPRPLRTWTQRLLAGPARPAGARRGRRPGGPSAGRLAARQAGGPRRLRCA